MSVSMNPGATLFAVMPRLASSRAKDFVAAIVEHHPDAVGISAFLTTTMPALVSTITAITEAGLRETTKIIVGGAPVTEEYAMEVGADGYAPNAVAAVRRTKALLGHT